MSVHLKISDRNWILETMAQNLSSRLDYITYDTVANSYADIQYYLTYSTFRERVSPIEMAYFTHLEEDPEVAARFFNTAKTVDVSVCMAKIYANMLEKRGVQNVHVIPPGVDLERFDVKLRIGIVGRTYVTGRKGEALMAQVMDTPGVEFIFTGDGWPGPGLHLKEEEVPDFYRTLDYVLVPAQYEGGPMSAIEALASGVEVIAPPIGWMPELPHIPYKKNDAADLRRVLGELVKQRRKNRTAILDRSWDDWATMHDKLFRKLLPSKPKPVSVAGIRAKAFAPYIVTHGMENVARGGPSTRIPQLDTGLKLLGYNSVCVNYGTGPLDQADLFHLFNVATPQTAERAMNGLKSFERPIVFSPIYLDNRCRNLWARDVPGIFKTSEPLARKIYALKKLQYKAQSARQSSIQQDRTLPVSYHQGVARLLEASDEVIYLSSWEKQILEDATGVAPQGHVVFNPVRTEPFRNADPKVFQDAFGVKDYVLCVGRVEPRKNQLILAAALSGTGIPLVLAGAAFDKEYIDLIRKIPDLELIETGHVDSGSEILSSAFAGCRVFCLPSWSEGAPIAALEASAAGCRMVLSSYSSEREYFGDRATYVDPANAPQLRAALQAVYDAPFTKAQRHEMSDFTAETFSVERHVEKTREVYDTLLATLHSPVVRQLAPKAAGNTVYFDVTTLLNNPGRITGITRVELSLVRSLRPDDDIQCIAWHSIHNFYFYVDEDLLDFHAGPTYRTRFDLRRVEALPQNAPVFLQGNAWLGNGIYVMALEKLVRSNNLRLTVVVHDVMPISHPQYFSDEQAATLENHLSRLSAFTAKFCADSHATRLEMEAYFSTRIKLNAPIDVIRLGDGLEDGLIKPQEDDGGDKEVNPKVDALLAEGNYVLSVGSQMIHKNRSLLMHIWNRLVADMGRRAPTLVIVGKTSTDQPDTVLNKAARSKVVTLHSLSDDYLDKLYENCLFTAFPSLCEGWGLPVTESLMHGKICIASNISSMPEIAPECTDLIDPLDTTAWYRRVRFYATSAESRRTREAHIAKNFVQTSWHTTLGEMAGIARKAPLRNLDAVPWDLEKRFDVADLGHCAALSFTKSSAVAGTKGTTTSFKFALTYFSPGPVFMNILCSNRIVGAVEVLLNGEVIDTLVLDFKPEAAHVVMLPAKQGTQAFNITFRDVDDIGFELTQFTLTTTADRVGSLPKESALSPMHFPFDTQIAVNRENKDVARLLGDGWYSPEVRACWSGPRARLRLPLGKLSGGALNVAFKYMQITDGPVFINVSGLFGTFMNKTNQNIEIPAWAVAKLGSYLDLEISVPNAASPKECGIGEDERILGIYLSHLAYSEQRLIEPILEGTNEEVSELSFAKMLGEGWHQPEDSFVWSRGLSQLRLPPAPKQNLYPLLSIGAIVDHTLHIFANGAHIMSVDLVANSPAEIALPNLGADGSVGGVKLTLVSTVVASPAHLGISQDPRPMGIRLLNVGWAKQSKHCADQLDAVAAPVSAESMQLHLDVSPNGTGYSQRAKRKLKNLMGLKS